MELAKDEKNFELDIDIRIRNDGINISSNYLINKLNQTHFLDNFIYINFIEKNSNRLIKVKAIPQPCMGKELYCHLIDNINHNIIHNCSFHSVFLNDKDKLMVFKPTILGMNESEIVFRLFPESKAVNSRSSKRYSCEGISARIIRGHEAFNGLLVDMNSTSLRVALRAPVTGDIEIFDHGDQLDVELFSGDERIFSGLCRFQRTSAESEAISLVLSPLESNMRYMTEKVHRSGRVQLTPLPEARFYHPLIGRDMALKIEEISGTGFSVLERESRGMLFPGMDLPRVGIHIAPGFVVSCAARVVHCIKNVNKSLIKYGLAITKVSAEDHVKLVAHLQQVRNPWAYVSCDVEVEDIWELFFNSGFVYPKKYAAFHSQKDAINNLYQKLYRDNSLKFIKNLIYKENGIIKGHIGLVRTYTHTWLMQHLAGKGLGSEMPGLAVLNQVGSFINDSYGMESNEMRYASMYYRPDNKVPNLLFGGVARSAKNPKVCSMDTFAYFLHPNPSRRKLRHGTAVLEKASDKDLLALADFYERRSGGLMIEALDLVPERAQEDVLEKVYAEKDFFRERTLYSLKKEGILKAVIMVYRSAVGLNLSDLINGLHVWVVDAGGLSPAEFKNALSEAASVFEQPHVAVNLYPREAAERLSVKVEKEYTLWIMEMKHSDHYFNHLQRISRFFRN